MAIPPCHTDVRLVRWVYRFAGFVLGENPEPIEAYSHVRLVTRLRLSED